jgi:Zn-dependent M28 family amino/carboxypeptidase
MMLTKDTLSTIKTEINKGYTISCFVPYDVEETTLYNVTGVIKGSNPTKAPVILSGHFDHVGTDLGGNVYTGALDNASGAAFVLEMGKYLKSLGTPERDIILIGFNAEEFGCLGSKAFVEKYASELKGSKVFNFDMIGTDSNVPLSIMGSKKDTDQTSFIRSVSSTAESANISFRYLFEDASDHEYFRKYGIDAVTFCDNDLSRIHTPQDRSQYIDTASIDRCFKVASREVIKYGYGNNLLLLYYNKTLPVAWVGCVLILFFFLLFFDDSREEKY